MSNIPKITGPLTAANAAVGRTTGQLKANEIQKLVDVLPIADQANLAATGTAPAPVALPPVFSKLSPRDQQALRELPPHLATEVLTKLPSNIDAARAEVSNRLLAKAQGLVGGDGVTFEPAHLFRVSDAAIAFKVLSDLTPADRGRLEGLAFRRVGGSTFDEGHQGRETDGAAIVEVERGKGMFGKLGFKAAALFEMWAMTAPLGLMLKAWFPHALSEYRSRVIEIGDAQAQRMKEVMFHEIGHQVQFGAETDYAGMAEWAKLSGWKDGAGGAAMGVDSEGQVRALNPGVRPTRTDNFVYQDFTEDLTPKKLQAALAEISDPELRKEFETTAKVKRTMQAAIKEVFGVEAMGYSMVNPLEDFAETFRAFYNDDALLVRKAPDKFLFLNAQSRRFAPDQVAEMFKSAGKDPMRVATGLAQTGISQETIDKIFKANGLKADVKVLGTEARGAAAAARSRNEQLPAFREAFMTIQTKVADQDLQFISTFTKDPGKALGEGVWNRLSPAEQAQFGTEPQRVSIVQRMQRGAMSYASGAAQGYKEIEREAIKNFGEKLIDDPNFRKALQENPRRALAAVSRNLPPALLRAVADPAMAASFKTFAGTIDQLLRYDQHILVGGGDLKKMFQANLENLDEATLDASIGTLKSDPKRMAEVFCGIGLVEVNGIKVPPGG